MTPNSYQQILTLWYGGLDTLDIARRLSITEAEVYNVLSLRIKPRIAA